MQMPPTTAQNTETPDSRRMMDKAKELEAAFLSEMLSHAGLSGAPESFGGGSAEEQFTSFLRNEQARLIVDKGGIGLAELIFQSMLKAEGKSHDA